MANNHSELTVNTLIPTRLVNGVELDVLEELGFRHEKSPVVNGDQAFYFYCEEGLDPEPMFNIEDPIDYLHQVEQEYPQELGKKRPEWVSNLVAGLEKHITEEGDVALEWKQLLDEDAHIEIFQGILGKPGCELEHITLEGACYCDKMRRGEFGGYAIRIYPNRIVSIGTPSTIDSLEEIAAASQRVLSDWESGDLAGAVRHLKATVDKHVPGYLSV